MAYLSQKELEGMGFKNLGRNVKISDRASVYNAELISIGDYSRIDDYCVLSGCLSIGSYVHVTPMCLIAGGEPGISIDDFCTLAYGVKLFAQSDDYSGSSMVNSLIPKKYKNEKYEKVILQKHVVVGTNSTVFPGVTIGEGCSIGAMTLVSKSTNPWGIYVGIPAFRLKDRKKELLALEERFLKERSF